MPHFWKTASLKLAGVLASSLARMNVQEIESVAKHAFKETKGDAAASLSVFCDMVHDLEHSAPNNVFDAGEARLLELVKPFGFKSYFDVGANIAEWVNAAAAHSEGARIDCFEIVPATFEKLKTAVVAGTADVRLNAFGLSDHEGEIQIYLGDTDYISSQYDFDDGTVRGSVSCQVRRGDAYAAEQGIERVDFLKIDVEGAEGAVMHGLTGLLDKQAIRLVQFEYNRGAIVSRFLLLDFYEFFTPRGYVLGKLTTEGVKWREYEYAYEDFNGPNYIACLKTDRALIEAISAPG